MVGRRDRWKVNLRLPKLQGLREEFGQAPKKPARGRSRFGVCVPTSRQGNVFAPDLPPMVRSNKGQIRLVAQPPQVEVAFIRGGIVAVLESQ